MNVIIAFWLAWLMNLPAHAVVSVTVIHPSGARVASPADEFCDRADQFTICTMTPADFMRTIVVMEDGSSARDVHVRACVALAAGGPQTECREIGSAAVRPRVFAPLITR